MKPTMYLLVVIQKERHVGEYLPEVWTAIFKTHYEDYPDAFDKDIDTVRKMVADGSLGGYRIFEMKLAMDYEEIRKKLYPIAESMNATTAMVDVTVQFQSE